MNSNNNIALQLEEEKQARKLAEEAQTNLQRALDALKEKEEENSEQKENIFKLQAKEMLSLALISVENPNPVLRISLTGDILYQNPAAHLINQFEYKDQMYEQIDFWKFISALIASDSDRLDAEVKAGDTTFLLDCMVLKEKGYIDVFGKDISKEKIAEEREQIAERRWKFAIEGQSGGIWEYNLQTKVIEYSLQYRSMLGYELDEFAKDAAAYQKLVHPKDVKAFHELTTLYTAGRIDSHMLEYRVQCKDQTYKWVMDRGQLITRTPDGRPEIIMGINTDITRRKEEERILFETEQRWKLALEGSGEGVWEYNHITKEFYISDVGKNILDLKDQDWKRKGWRSLVHPDDKPLLVKVDRDYLEGKIRFHQTEYRILQSNGEYKWIRDKGTLVSKTEDGKPVKFIGLIADISQRKKTEEELRLSEEKYRSVIDGIKLGLLEVDDKSQVLYVNHSFCAMTGYTYDELIGKKVSDVPLLQLLKEAMLHKEDLIKAPRPGVYEISVQAKNGEPRWWLISSAPLYDLNHNIIGSVGVHLDATPRKILEDKLVEAKQIAEESVKAKDIFMANMSHEIRTPMNAILGLSHLLQKTSLTPQQQSYLSSIHTATNNLLGIINDILDFSKIEAGKLVIENIGFNLPSLLQDALNFFIYGAENKGLKLAFNCDSSLHDIFIGDPYRTNQILINLLSNAVKFTDAGTIIMSCNVLLDEADAQLVMISVTDTGIGMDEEFQKKLFEEFLQEEESTTRKYGGSGLGMSITKQLVDLMMGDITVVSKKNEGTAVSVKLRLKKGNPDDLPQIEPLSGNDINFENVSILIAEDNDMNRLVASTILEQYGVVVDEAVNGKLAVEKAATKSYDLILMDIRMPEIDGFEATRLIRNNNKTVPIIALTAHLLKEEADKCLTAGMNDFLVKPYRENELTNIILKWLRKTGNSKKIHIEETHHPLYDLTQLNEMSNNSKIFITKMLDLFIEVMPEEINKMQKALEENNMEIIKNIAHTIKPVIDNMNIITQKIVIRKIEELASTNENMQQLAEHVVQFKDFMKRVVEEVKAERTLYE